MEKQNENQNPPTEELKEEKPTLMGGLKDIGFGLVLFGLVYYFYTTMTAYESGDGIRMNSLLLLAYKFLGKNLTAGILGLFGLLVTYTGIKEIIKSQSNEAK